MTPRRPLVVGISGPTCTGKSTLGAIMGGKPDAVFIPEPDPSALLLDMLKGNEITAAKIQNLLVRERYRRIQEALYTATYDQVILIDRMLSEDQQIFFRLHYLTGSINAAELADLDELVGVMSKDVVEPDFYIFLTADKATLHARLSQRPEGAWLLDHLELQLTLYGEYRTRLEASGRPILFIDTSGLGPDCVSAQSQMCWTEIDARRPHANSNPVTPTGV